MVVEEKSMCGGEVRAGKIVYVNWAGVLMSSIQVSQGILCSWNRGIGGNLWRIGKYQISEGFISQAKKFSLSGH